MLNFKYTISQYETFLKYSKQGKQKKTIQREIQSEMHEDNYADE